MKILRIGWQNIHSLRSAKPESVDLEAAPFCGNGLFTITGPTGAGKSTLLDVVCLALYGRTPRFGDSASPAEHVMSWGAGECFAEVDYAIDDQRYRSRWSCHRSRRKADGPMQSPTMQVIRIDVTPPQTLHTLNSAVTTFNEARIGLKFEHFRRAILLAQGQFAEFLKGKAENRRDLLERLTDTQIYVALSKEVYRRASVLAQALAEVRQRRAEAAAQILPAPEAEARSAALNEADERLEALARERTALALERERRAELARLEAALADGVAELAACEARRAERSEDAARLSAHEQLDPLAEVIDTWVRNGAELGRLRSEAEADLERGPALRAAVEDATTQRKARAEAHAALRAAHDDAEPRWSRVTEMDGQRDVLRQQYVSAESALRSALAKADDTETRRARAQAGLDERAAAARALSEWLATHADDAARTETLSGLLQRLETCGQAVARAAAASGAAVEADAVARDAAHAQAKAEAERDAATAAVDAALHAEAEARARAEALLAGRAAEELTTQAEVLRAAWETVEAKRRDGEALSACRTALDALNAEETTTRAARDDAARAVEDAGRVVEARRALTTALRARHQAELMVLGTLPLRAKLVPGTPCPVCGSTTHPSAEDAPPDADATGAEVARAEAAASEAERAAESRRLQLGALEVRLQAVPDRADEIRARLRPGLDLDAFDAAHWSVRAAALATESARLEAERTGLEALRPRVRGALDALSAATETVTRCRTAAALAGQAALAAAQRAAEKADHALREAEAARRLTHEADLDLDALVALAGGPDAPPGVPPADRLGRVRDEIEALATRVRLYKTKAHEADAAERAVAAAALEVERAEGEQAQARAAVEAQRETVESLQAEGQRLAERRATLMPADRTPTGERQRSQASIDAADRDERTAEKTLNEARAALDQLAARGLEREARRATLEAMQGELDAEGRAHPVSAGRGVAELIAVRLTPTAAAALRATLQELTRAVETAAARQTQRLADRDRLLAVLDAEADAAELDARENANTVASTRLRTERDALRLALDRHRAAVQAVTACDAEMGERGAIAARWDKLDALIGSADGRKFATYAQSLNLRHLLGRANQHLARISGRYRMVAGDELRIDVEDLWQNETRRSVESLSGGETFVVSLALALGLADMASRNVRIDSLFIDEGFGTLDADVLEDVIAALESQVFSGKLVGVISHVDALKERIPIGLRVRPRGDGQSGVTIDHGGRAPQG